MQINPNRFDTIHQIGGIQTGSIDYPQPMGGQSCRVAFINTGSGLRLTVTLDRGGDIVEAAYNDTNLAYLTPNGYKPPSHAYHQGEDWLTGWPGGLCTTCGPEHIGGPREEDGGMTMLHGRFSNTPAAVVAIKNPNPAKGDLEMRLEMIIRDSRMYGPTFEVRRSISCTLGQTEIRQHDEVTNLADDTYAHNWLYHVNLGYPLIDEGTQLVYAGKGSSWQPEGVKRTGEDYAKLKTITGNVDSHTRSTSNVVLIDDLKTADDGLVHIGAINASRGIGFELAYTPEQLPRLGNWQHLGPRGTYVCGLEPYYGSLLGKNDDPHADAVTWLKPGESRKYEMQMKVLADQRGLEELMKCDSDVN